MCIGLAPENPWKIARKKPVIIMFREPIGKKELIHTLEGEEWAIRGKHFVIYGVKGELYPIDKKIFAETYEVLTDNEVLSRTLMKECGCYPSDKLKKKEKEAQPKEEKEAKPT